MRTILISLMLVMFTRVVYGDAVIFSGNDVKALKQNLDLFGTSKLMGTATDPSSGGGLAAPLSSIAMNYVTGIGYIKTSAPNTGWSRIVDTAYAPGVYFAQNGNAFGTTAVLGTTDANRLDFITGGVIGMSLGTTGALTVTSTNANSLAVGPAGSTNPVLQVDSSTASQATGIKVTGAAAGGGVSLAAISSGAAETLNLSSKGTGSVVIQTGGTNRLSISQTNMSFTPTVSSTANLVRYSITGGADTALTASTEAPSTYFNLGQARQHSTGALSLQRDFRVTPSTHSFVGASTLTNAAGFSVDGAPIASTNATITNSSAIYVPGSAVTSGVTNSYGLNINANTGATNNYAAIFNGGSVGIGVTNPQAALHSVATASGSNATALLLQNNGSTTSNTAVSLDFTNTNGTTGLATLGRIANIRTNRGTSGDADLAFSVLSSGSTTERMRIMDNGNVGIGNSAPGVLLQVTKTDANVYTPTSGVLAVPVGTSQVIDNLDTTNGTASLIQFSTKSGGTVNRVYMGLVSSTSPGGEFVFGQRTGSSSYAERFRIDYNGNLGIGTTAPSVRVDIIGNSGQQLRLSDTATDATNKISYISGRNYNNASTDVAQLVSFNSSTTNSLRIGGGSGVLNSATELLFYTGATTTTATGTQQMIINSSGNIGMGIAAPTSKLHQDSGTGTATYHQFTAGTTTGQTVNDGTLIGIDASGNAIFNNKESTYVSFLSNNTQRARITALGSFVVGDNSSTLSTSATDGFLYVSSSAGAPTGTPTTQTGSIPIHVDATNNAMYMYTNSAWRSVAGATVQGSRQTGTSMSVGTAITPALGSKTVAFVVGNGGAITITASPPITTTGMIVGQELRVCGTSNTNTVTYNNSVNLVLTGSATLGKDQCLDLMFSGTDGTNLSWIETGRSF